MLGKAICNSLPTICNMNDLPEMFGLYFQDKITKIRSCLDNSMTKFNVTIDNEPFQGRAFHSFSQVSEEEVKTIILSTPPKSCSLDPLPTEMLIKNIDVLCTTITNIINESLLSGVVPDSFKHAIIKPLLKKPTLATDDFKSYRPVSNLSYLSKVLEKVVLKQLKWHLLSNDLLDPYQSAYKENHKGHQHLL